MFETQKFCFYQLENVELRPVHEYVRVLLLFFTDARGAFSLFDKKDTGSLAIKDLGQVFRSCAMTVDSEQLSDWLSEMGCEG